MDREAVERIEELAVACDRLVADKTAYPVAVIPKNTQVVDLEQHQERRNQFRARFETETLDQFTDYVKYSDGKIVFIDHTIGRARCIFDLADNGHCRHTANLSLAKTPEYQAVCDADSNAMTQQELAEFVEDWLPNITAQDTVGAEMTSKKACSAIRMVTIEEKQASDHQVGQLSKSRSTLESIEAKNGDKPLPAWILFDCKPYDGFSERKFAFRISLLRGRGSEPVFKLHLQKLDKHKVEIGDEMAKKIHSELSDIKCYLGTLDVS